MVCCKTFINCWSFLMLWGWTVQSFGSLLICNSWNVGVNAILLKIHYLKPCHAFPHYLFGHWAEKVLNWGLWLYFGMQMTLNIYSSMMRKIPKCSHPSLSRPNLLSYICQVLSRCTKYTTGTNAQQSISSRRPTCFVLMSFMLPDNFGERCMGLTL